MEINDSKIDSYACTLLEYFNVQISLGIMTCSTPDVYIVHISLDLESLISRTPFGPQTHIPKNSSKTLD